MVRLSTFPLFASKKEVSGKTFSIEGRSYLLTRVQDAVDLRVPNRHRDKPVGARPGYKEGTGRKPWNFQDLSEGYRQLERGLRIRAA